MEKMVDGSGTDFTGAVEVLGGGVEAEERRRVVLGEFSVNLGAVFLRRHRRNRTYPDARAATQL
jgi:hypothetical protein